MTETTDPTPPAIKAKSPWWHTVLVLAIAIIIVKLGGMIAAIAAFAAFYFIRPRFGAVAAMIGGLAAAAVVGIAVVVGYSMAVQKPIQSTPAPSSQFDPSTAVPDKGSTLVDPQPPTKLIPFNGKLDGE